MCGRYALALWPSQIRRMLEDDNMPVYEAPDDPDDGNDENAGEDSGEPRGSGYYSGPRQSYNFAPGYRGVVYRADVPDRGAGPQSRHDGQDTDNEPLSSPSKGAKKQSSDTDEQLTAVENNDLHYKLQTMKWGLIPFWTKRNPGYGSMMKTINCRDDSLAQSGGMWSSMKGRKRCIVVVQGFYEWLKKDGGREKMPHYVKRKDGKLMCLAGLWDVVQYENDDEKLYTYTIITTDSNKQLNFLHDRMPVILENGSEKMRKWLDPKRYEWSKELQSLLVPYDGELEVYPVSKDVGKVGNNSPSFIIPIDSKENKSNIANFFAKGAVTKKNSKNLKEERGGVEDIPDAVIKPEQPEIEITETKGFKAEDDVDEADEAKVKSEDIEGNEDTEKVSAGIKREATEESTGEEPPKKLATAALNKNQSAKKNTEQSWGKGARRQKISATSNNSRSPTKASKSAGTQKITKFFANSS
ncbi:hypothetical protein F5B22DRAFT_631775 [Xylaria bambusicola]|uniref:uncharacterized protein n=1 Tax=Xylaria bambusicola TaxID=326684 RepID=UPI0020073DE4|nr:uncharacterized protein F5B22DRAFT_631775 [Xylaria bambusicola]KAI0502846.1 hypothetical protein F5B22DRAFT_631775 [Xylaria bambusicola]